MMTDSGCNGIKGDEQPEFCKVAENLYRRTATDIYYALLKRGGKQFRRSLKTPDRPWANRIFNYAGDIPLCSKGDLALQPIYHQDPERIEGVFS